MSNRMIYQVDEEFQRLKAIVQELAPTEIMEIGSLHGETLKHWLGIPTVVTVLSVDMLCDPSDARFQQQVQGHNETWYEWAKEHGTKLGIMDTDSTSPVTVDRVYDFWHQHTCPTRSLKDVLGSIDFLFIDGGHDFKTAALDYFNYSPLVRKGGVIAFHDRSNPDWPEVEHVWKALKRGFKSEEIGGRMGIGVLYV
jgi:hypothetical protein